MAYPRVDKLVLDGRDAHPTIHIVDAEQRVMVAVFQSVFVKGLDGNFASIFA